MLIPAQNTEIERIYNHIWKNEYRSIALCSAEAGEGVTTLALALCMRHLLAGHSTLVVDLNLYHPSFKYLLALKQENEETAGSGPTLLNSPSIVTIENSETSLLGITAPTDRASILKLRKPGVLEEQIAKWHENYDVVIMDCSPINRINARNIPAERIASASDASYLVVKTGVTQEKSIQMAVDRLEKSSGLLAGYVLNDMLNPSLKTELLRECKRLPKFMSWLSSWLEKKIENNLLLNSGF